MNNKSAVVLKIGQNILKRASDEVTYFENSNLYGCNLGDNVFIGPFIEIQNNVSIGNN